MRTTKTVTVEVPEIEILPLDPAVVQQLDTLCQAARVVQSEIKTLESTKAKLMDDGEGGGIRNLASALNLPERVLGTGWDLRRTDRTTESLDVAKLKLELLRLDIQFSIPCPKTQLSEDGQTVIVCPSCKGVGALDLEGLPAINHLIESCTDRKTSVSWSVYGRDEKKKEDPT